MRATVRDCLAGAGDRTCQADLSETLKIIDVFDQQDRSRLPTEPDNPDHEPRFMLEVDFGERHALLYLEALKPAGHDIFLQVATRKFFIPAFTCFESARLPSPKEDVVRVITACFERDATSLLAWAKQQLFLKPSRT